MCVEVLTLSLKALAFIVKTLPLKILNEEMYWITCEMACIVMSMVDVGYTLFGMRERDLYTLHYCRVWVLASLLLTCEF